MIDSLIAATDKVLAKHAKRPLFLDGAVQRQERISAICKDMTHEQWLDFRRDVLAIMSCYVSDGVWDYCLQEAMKPLEGK